MKPTYDPHTQKLATSVGENGETVYTVESYSVEEMNDGSQWYVDFFKEVIEVRLRLLETEVLPRILSSDTEGLQLAQEYKNKLLSITDFPPGFYVTDPPTIKNVPQQFFIVIPTNLFKFKNTMKVTKL